ncbi:hypothetical protein EDB19DRAFT_1897770 [Suillus lakei]|nr:hypothetical protein EDB19DRAFT_1897770 [Suillus lakei]
MAIMLDNANEAVLPDFRTGEYRAERARLLTNSIADEALAAQLLAVLWTMSNNAAKDAWEEQVEQAARDAEQAQHLADQEEQEAACKEEHKKNKSKFIPVGVAKVPTAPIVIPSHYTVRKLKTGDSCKLYYFTNKGLREARKNLISSELQGMILMPTEDGQQMWVNADETCDPKSIVTKDENLSWEQFNEVAPHMITAMKQHEHACSILDRTSEPPLEACF